MALSSVIQFGDNELKKYSREYLLADLSCHFSRKDNMMRPTTDAICESLIINVIIPEKHDRFLYEWFINNVSNNGRILVEISDPLKDNEQVWKEILFEDAVCYSIKEYYNIDTTRRALQMGLVATKFIFSDVAF